MENPLPITFTAPNEKYGNYSNLDLTTGTLITSQTGGVNTRYSNVSPRFGFDATIAPNTVIRGGFGINFFASDIQKAFHLLNPPYAYASGTVTYTTPLSAGIVSPTTNLSGSVVSKTSNFRDAYTEQFNLLVQRDFRGNVLTVGYVGNLGRHLLSQVPNLGVPAPSGSSMVPARPYAGLLSNVNTIQFWGGYAASNYNSLQTSFQRRFQRGFTLNANYTLAHTMGDVNETNDAQAGYGLLPSQIGTYDYGNGIIDVRHRIAVTADYQIPFSHGAPHWAQSVFGGWQINALSFWQTGLPIPIVSSVTQTTNSTGQALAYINLPTITTDRPNRIGNPALSHPTISQFFNVSDFVRQPIGTAGNAGVNQVYGPHQRRTDLSFLKAFPIYEQFRGEFRAEAFNISNTPNFAAPGGTITGFTQNAAGQFIANNAGGFGVITATSPGSAARQFQFALKVYF
jgi:hypothetical protein